jgi:ribosome-binding protein aMBF1 (putative translation factor)
MRARRAALPMLSGFFNLSLHEEEYLSIGELATKAGASRSIIHDLESGKHNPIRRTIRALAKALG